jgi:hypothetical protein
MIIITNKTDENGESKIHLGSPEERCKFIEKGKTAFLGRTEIMGEQILFLVTYACVVNMEDTSLTYSLRDCFIVDKWVDLDITVKDK